MEWEVKPDGVITSSSDTPDCWVLLDGGWQLNCGRESYPSHHDEAGKLFRPSVAVTHCVFVTTEHNYVMRTKEADMQNIFKKGFAFNAHLDSGFVYYQSL